jgi:glucokinase
MIRPVLAIDIGGTKIRSAVLADHAVVRRVEGSTRPSEGPDAVLLRVVGLIDAARDDARDRGVEVGPGTPVVVATTGPVSEDGRWVDAASLGRAFFDYPLGRRLADATGREVIVGVDTHLALLGERRAGALRGQADAIYITVSTGIGGAFLSAGRLVAGAHRGAGEVGHLPVLSSGPHCSCGGRGHLEVVSSGTAIATAATRLAMRSPGSGLGVRLAASGATRLSAREVDVAAADGDADAQRILRRARSGLARGVVALVNVVDPAAVAIGGGVVLADPEPWIEACRDELDRSGLATQRANTSIVVAELGDDSALIGAQDYLDLRRARGPSDVTTTVL